MSATAQQHQDKGESAYQDIVDEVEHRAKQRGGEYIQAVRSCAAELVTEQTRSGDVRRFVAAVISYSERGPHPKFWKDHPFDIAEPEGSLRAIAADCLASDAIAQGNR